MFLSTAIDLDRSRYKAQRTRSVHNYRKIYNNRALVSSSFDFFVLFLFDDDHISHAGKWDEAQTMTMTMTMTMVGGR